MDSEELTASPGHGEPDVEPKQMEPKCVRIGGDVTRDRDVRQATGSGCLCVVFDRLGPGWPPLCWLTGNGRLDACYSSGSRERG